MIDKNNPLSNMSYTSKDFSTIYPELMELAKRLSNKWDPTASNESDPGVVLIKENAILGDKLNYNIDKNILETSPVSVTQIANARHLFEQLGYNCSWYRSATTRIGLTWAGADSDIFAEADSKNVVTDFEFTIPAFTVFTNADGSKPYTIYKDITLGRTTSTAGSLEPITLQAAGDVEAIQGTPVVYNVHDTDIIKVLNLDDNNRLYFSEKNIAENGIFIWNEGDLSKEYWTLVDNLQLEPYGRKVFKFGVTPVDEICYIEFPDDVTELFDSGVHITYIKTLGTEGNTIAYDISKFMQSTTVDITDIRVNSEVKQDNVSKDISSLVRVSNVTAALNGANPETIDDSYDNYLKTVGVFKTLVSLSDYDNYINLYGVEKGLTSKSYTADRSSDIQTSYCILTIIEGIETLEKQFEVITGTDNKKLNPYNLKMFLLQYKPDAFTGISSVSKDESERFNATFKLITELDALHKIYPDITQPESYKDSLLYDLKHIQHDILEPEIDSMCFIVNKYGIRCRIIPNVTLTSQAQADIKANIRANLFNNLNAKKVDFGKEIDYNYVHNLILNSDNRINTVILDDIYYTPSAAVIKEANDVKSTEFVPLEDTSQGVEVIAKSILNGNTPLLDFKDFPFKTNIMNENQQVIDKDNIVAIKGNYNATLSSNDTTVLPNGVVTILEPTTHDANSWPVGCKFIMTSIDENSTWTLGKEPHLLVDGEALDVYINPADSDDNYYRVTHYGPGAKVRLEGTTVEFSNNETDVRTVIGDYIVNNNLFGFNSRNDEGFGTAVSAIYSKLVEVSNNLESNKQLVIKNKVSVSVSGTSADIDLNEILKELTKPNASLSTGQEIFYVADNCVTFDSNKKPVKLSWVIVNNDPNTYNDYYSKDLVFKKTDTIESGDNTYKYVYSYILKQSEYLYYTEPNASYMQELTEGFLIEIVTNGDVGDELTLSLGSLNDIPNPTEVYMLGPAAINKWATLIPDSNNTVNSGTVYIESLNFYEMKATRLYEGDKIKCSYSVTLSSEDYILLSNGADIFYTINGELEGQEHSISVQGNRYFAKTSCLIKSSASNANKVYSDGINYETVILYSNVSYDFTVSNSQSFPIELGDYSDSFEPGQDISIALEYTDSSGKRSWVTLNSFEGWYKLSDTYFEYMANIEPAVEGAININHVNILLNSSDDGDFYLYVDSGKLYLDAFAYPSGIASGTYRLSLGECISSPYYFNTNLEINHDCSQLTRTTSENENGEEVKLKIFKFTLPDGITNPYNYSTEVSIGTNTGIPTSDSIGYKYALLKFKEPTAGTIFDSVESNPAACLLPYGTPDGASAYWLVELKNTNTYLKFNSDATIEYVKYCDYAGIFSADVANKLATLDSTYKFKADNEPSPENLITNPLDGFELFNQIHYLHDYTIPMLDTSSIDIKFVNISNVRGR